MIVRCISFLLVLSSVAGISEASSLPAIRDGPPSNGTSISIDGHTLPAVFQTVAYGALMAVGLGEVAAGYRLFRATLFILGGASGGIPTFLLAWDHISDPNAVWIACGLGVMAALLSGVASYFLYKLGVFLCGAALGVVVALIVNMAVLYKLVPGSNVPLIVLAVALGLVFGALGFRYMRLTMVASTSAVGAYAFIRSVGFFAGHYPGNEFDIATELQNGETNLRVFRILGGARGDRPRRSAVLHGAPARRRGRGRQRARVQGQRGRVRPAARKAEKEAQVREGPKQGERRQAI